MGHRFSKTAANNIAANKTSSINENAFKTASTTTKRVPIRNGHQQHQTFLGSTINFQIQGSPTADSSVSSHITAAGILQQQHQHNTHNNISSSLTSVNNLSSGRQIIIKIQLAKMENGNETSSSASLSQHQQERQQDTSFENLQADCNLNSRKLSTTVTAAGTQFLNLTLNSNSNSNSMANSTTNAITNTCISTPSSTLLSTASPFRTAGSSINKNNNYFHSNNGGINCSGNNSILSASRINERLKHFNSLKFNDEIVEQNIGEIVEYCEVLEDHHPQPQASADIQMLSINEEPDNEPNVCCRRKSKSLSANVASISSTNNNNGAKNKVRCRKCSCREAFRRFLDPSLARSSNKTSKHQKEQKRTKSQDRHSIINPILNSTSNEQQTERNSLHSININSNTTSPSTAPATATAAIVVPTQGSSQVAVWSSASATNGSDVIIPLPTPTPPQFVVVQCAIVNPSNASLHSLPNTNVTTSNHSLISIAAQDIIPSTSSCAMNDLVVKVPSNNTRPSGSTALLPTPIVHSQVDFVHYLVPDLERITNSSFYWGKMDRYEAERLLEGKPEGTFLLRDSAQEEFLFSVTFRKYGRSLHARIEQSDHRFSFDCHDPCVFTASTVTGLLEHYKDPACVMFFEPMLTIPLHRRDCFSLQKLCRAAIVSNTTYDGINALELPARLRSYLKEYHYKQKLRVKSNEPTYSVHCK